MDSITFHPARLHGSASVPPAKSEAHRALLLAALGHGQCRLHGFLPPLCDDTNAMIAGITALGAKVLHEGDVLSVSSAPEPIQNQPMVTCHVHACAAALRMLIPAFLVRGQPVCFTMEPALFARPLDAFEPLIAKIDGSILRSLATDGTLATVTLSGTMLAGDYTIDGSQSSQFASGLLIALAHSRDAAGVSAPSTLKITKPIVSRPYLDMTLQLMNRFHVPYKEVEEGVFSLSPAQVSAPNDVHISGDWSQAAVLLCINAMGGGVMLRELCENQENCLQGDAHVLSILSEMGIRLYHTRDELYAVSPSHACLIPVSIDCTDIPDLAPILALTCTQALGTSLLTGVSRLRLKECDRLRTTIDLLTQLGANVSVSVDDNELTIRGRTKLHGGFEANALGDHRIVMLLAAAALFADAPITVHGTEALSKSWPGFLNTYQQLGGTIS